MPLLSNPRHEKFAQLVASGMSGTKAYISAGFSENGAAPSANKLLKQTQVAERVQELKEALVQASVKGAALTRESVLDRLATLSVRAEQEKQIAAAIRAEELRGKEIGMFVDRSNAKVELDQKNLSELSPAALEEILKALRKRAAQAVPAEEKSEVGGEVVQ